MTINQKRVITVLSFILAILLAIVSYFGVFVSSTYERDNASMAAQGIGQDFVNLFLIVPLLVIIVPFLYQDKKYALLIHAGTLFYILYSFIIYAFGVHFNGLFLFYCLILGLSFYTFVYIIQLLSKMDIQNCFSDKIPRKSVAVFLFLISIVFYLLWFKDIIPAILSNTIPESVSDYDLLVNPVHVIDIAFALPGLIISAILLLKNHKLGYIFSAVALEFIILLAIALIGMVVMLKLKGCSDDISIAIIFSVIAVAGLIFLSFLFKKKKTT